MKSSSPEPRSAFGLELVEPKRLLNAFILGIEDDDDDGDDGKGVDDERVREGALPHKFGSLVS